VVGAWLVYMQVLRYSKPGGIGYSEGQTSTMPTAVFPRNRD
jgi:hypothetical protein